MTVRRTVARSLGVLALTAPLGLVLGAPAALAATGPAAFDASAPADGTQFTGADTPVTVSATLPACTKQQIGSGCASTVTSTLTLSAPGQAGQSVTKKSTTSAQDLTLTVPAGLPNAVWTVTLTGAPSRTFTIDQVNVPESFSADGSGARDVAFAWNKGSEPGITGYVLADSNGTIIDDSITPEKANCASSTRCTYGLYYPKDNPGSHGYQLVAKRTSSSGGTVTSGQTTANATLTTPPKPTPTPTPAATAGPSSSPAPGGGGSTGGGDPTTSGGSPATTTGGASSAPSPGSSADSTGGTISTGGAKPTLPPNATNPVLAGRKAFALTFNAFSPSLGIPKLPPLPATDLPSLSEAPLPLGTYKPSLPYQGQTETTSSRSLLSSPTAFVETITDPEQLAKSIAGALILLLIGAHLRRFLGTHVED